jgi:hypothetical protein
MRVPHTIPRVVLKAYTRKLDPEELEKSYEGRLLRSEDPSWDAKLKPTLSQLCLDLVLEDYVFYVKLVEELNRQKLEDYEKSRDKWIVDVAEYTQRKTSYERKMFEQQYSAIYGGDIIDPDKDDDDDAFDDTQDDDGKLTKKVYKEPTKVPSQFSEFEPIKGVLDQMWDEDRVKAAEDLEFEYIPFEMSVATIPDEHYWERAAGERWPVRKI